MLNYGLRWLRAWFIGFSISMLGLLIWALINLPDHDQGLDAQITLAVYWSTAFTLLTIIPIRQICKKGRLIFIDAIRGLFYFALCVITIAGTAYCLLHDLWHKELLENTLWAIGIAVTCTYLPPFYIYIREMVVENALFRRSFIEGRGPSARWAGPSTYKKFRSDGRNIIDKIRGLISGDNRASKAVYLGDASFDDNFFDSAVYTKDDSHLLTVGMTGSGKICHYELA